MGSPSEDLDKIWKVAQYGKEFAANRAFMEEIQKEMMKAFAMPSVWIGAPEDIYIECDAEVVLREYENERKEVSAQ